MRPYYLLPFLLCLDSYAQVARTSLTGSVTDQQGRPVPSARVKAISIATGLKREVETGMQGNYALADLGLGTYLIGIDKEGFATLRLQNVTLEVGHTRPLDVPLGLAARTDQVNGSRARNCRSAVATGRRSPRSFLARWIPARAISGPFVS